MKIIFPSRQIVCSARIVLIGNFIITGLSLIILAGCKLSIQNPQPNQETYTSSFTPSPSTQKPLLPSLPPFLSPTPARIESSATSTLLQGAAQKQCLKITTASRSEIRSVDNLILFDRKGGIAYFWNSARDNQIYLPLRQGSRVVDPSVSPDHKYVLYYDAGSGKDWKSVIADSDARVIWNEIKTSFQVYGWFDSHRLWDFETEQNAPGKFFLVDPFNNTKQKLMADFPSMNINLGNSFWSLPETVYDPNLKRVVYAACIDRCPAIPGDVGSGFAVVMYNMETDKVVTSLLTQNDFGMNPLWLPDGSAFIMAANIFSENSTEYEFFSVSRDGNIRQISHLREYLSNYEIAMNYTLSPDGRFLAFWLNDQPTPSVDGKLAILDLHNGNLMDYCISGASWNNAPFINNYLSPVWSPDGEQLAIMSPNPELSGASQISLINLVNGTATRIVDMNNVIPIGWMQAP
jgi:hypothetical protein